MIRLLLALLFLLSGCEKSDKFNIVSFSGEAMTIPYRVLIGKELPERQMAEVEKIILDTFYEIDLVYNKWNPHSEISRLNRSKALHKVPISSALEDFLLKTDTLIALSDGKFDPTIESVQKAWKESLKEGKLPRSEELLRLAEGVGWKKVHISEGVFWKEHDLLEIDLGAIAKGYAIDLLTERLNRAGYQDIYVEWGGEIRVSGRHPENRPWRIFISKLGDPDPEAALAIVDMQDNAVASSGDYLQNWTVDGTTYFHIIDPKTCRPLIATGSSICSVTVIAPTCALADFLATTAMIFPSKSEAEVWLESLKDKIPEIRYWVVSRSEISKYPEVN